MKNTLYIITPISRPENIPAMRESIRACEPFFWTVWLKTDKPAEDRFGNIKRNLLLGQVPNSPYDFVRFLDDDNLLHPAFPEIASRALLERSGDLFMFRQAWGDGSIRTQVDPPRIENNHLDTDQLLIRGSAIKGARWPENIYEADYHFARAVADKGAKVEIVMEVASQYNVLRK